MYPKERLIEKTKGGKEERETANNNEVHRIYVGTTLNETY
jgi:hypothetical protein